MKEITKKLAIALGALMDVQNGALLIKDKEEWNDAMSMGTEALYEYRKSVKDETNATT